jgi:hypothetical protein
MSVFGQSSVPRGDDGMINTIVYKLRKLAPGIAAMSYPFLLNGFRLSAARPSCLRIED